MSNPNTIYIHGTSFCVENNRPNKQRVRLNCAHDLINTTSSNINLI